VTTRLLELRDKVIRFEHTMLNGETGEVSAVTELTGVHMDTGARKSCPFPSDVLAQARAYLEAPAP
jgi:acyl-CoA thioester hydrolase